MELSSGGAKRLVSTPNERHEAGRIINLYLDEEMRYAISVFCTPPGTVQPESDD